MTISNLSLPSELQTKLADLAAIFEGTRKPLLQVAGLDSPAVVPRDKASTQDLSHWTNHRDIHNEIGISVQTLTELRLVSGQLLEIRNPACSARPRIVRLLAVGFHDEPTTEYSSYKYPGKFPRKGWAYLSPMLIHALGYNWALMPFLPTATESQEYNRTEKLVIKPVDPRCRSFPGGRPIIVEYRDDPLGRETVKEALIS